MTYRTGSLQALKKGQKSFFRDKHTQREGKAPSTAAGFPGRGVSRAGRSLGLDVACPSHPAIRYSAVMFKLPSLVSDDLLRAFCFPYQIALLFKINSSSQPDCDKETKMIFFLLIIWQG